MVYGHQKARRHFFIKSLFFECEYDRRYGPSVVLRGLGLDLVPSVDCVCRSRYLIAVEYAKLIIVRLLGLSIALAISQYKDGPIARVSGGGCNAS